MFKRRCLLLVTKRKTRVYIYIVEFGRLDVVLPQISILEFSVEYIQCCRVVQITAFCQEDHLRVEGIGLLH